MKRSNDEKIIRRSIMAPIWIYRTLSILYVLIILFAPFGKKDTGAICYGRGNLLNYIMLFVVFLGNLRIIGFIDVDAPIFLVSMFVKLVQVIIDYFLLSSSKINFVTLALLFIFEVMLSLIEAIDKKSFKYVGEKIN